MLKAILLVGLGGGAGSIFRYLTSVVMNRWFETSFPWPTFTVNIIGSFLIGLLLGLFEKHSLLNPDLRLLLIAGFCGGYTTFSAFALENFALFQSNQSFLGLLYIIASILFGLLAVWLGIMLMK